VKKVESGVTTYYLRSTVLGGQVLAELNGSGGWNRGYVYSGSQLLAIQYMGVSWVHQEPFSKGQRITNSAGSVTATVELDPWGGDTARSANQAFQPHRFTTYERDANGGDDAMMRRYHGAQRTFTQPDPFDGSCSLADPQSLNRYAYTQNDPVNLVDPTGLNMASIENCVTISVDSGGTVVRYRECWTQIIIFDTDPSPNPGTRDPIDPPATGGGGNPQNAKPTPQQQTPEYCLSDFIDAMKTAWAKTGNGTSGTEAGFAGIKKLDGQGGSYSTTRDLPFTNEKRNVEGREHLSFPWSAVYQSIWHVHPRGGPPSDVDQALANDKKVPIYSFGRDGLYVYKPGDTAPVKLRDNFDWTKSCDKKPPLR
jgi:RHS repeat-associated protein